MLKSTIVRSLIHLSLLVFLSGCAESGGGSEELEALADKANPNVSLESNTTTVPYMGSVTLEWLGEDVAACVASGDWSGAKESNDSETIGGLTADSTFLLNCLGPEGVIGDRVDVSVQNPSTPTVSISASPSNVIMNGSTTLSWSSTNVSSCTASGDWSGAKATTGSQTISALTSDSSFSLTCSGLGGNVNDTVNINVSLPSAPSVNLSASPSGVAYDGSTTLSWTSSNVDSCVASGDWRISGNINTSGSSIESNLTSNKTYTLTCTGAGGNANDSINVTVAAPGTPSVNLTANPTSIAYDGSTTLIWNSANADNCTASGSWSGSKASSGAQTINNLTTNSNFNLSCSGPGGNASDSASVNVGAPGTATVILSASPLSVAYDGSTVLSWTSSDVDSCVASGDWRTNGNINTSGSSIESNLTSNKTYTLACTGAGGNANDSITVTVAAPGTPSVNLTANPTSIAYDGSTTLIWNSTNADNCTASGSWSGSKASSGTQTISNLTTNSNFYLSCSGPGGNASDSASVNVGAPGTPTVTLSANPSSITFNGSTTLNWSSSETDTCTASGAWSGSKATSGTQTINNLTSNSNFSLSCSSASGSANDSANVTVSGGSGGDPLNLPLVQASDNVFSFRGTYNIPSTLIDDDGRAGGGYAVSQDGQFMYLNSFFGKIAKYRIPAFNGMATLEFGWTSTPDSVSSANKVHSALLEHNGNLYNTKYAEYTTNPTTKWIQRGNTAGNNFTGLFNISGISNARRVAQGFMHIPADWQGLLGGPVAALGGRVSIVGNAQNGYGFAVFDPSDIGGSNRVTPLLDYTLANPLEPGGPSYSGWNSYPKNSSGGTDLFSQTNAPLAGAFIVPGSRSLLFVTAHGYGSPGSGNTSCRPGSSVSNDPYRIQVVAYDLRDLVDVKVGAASPSSVRPYTWWSWNAGGVHWNGCVGEVPLNPGFGTYDPANNRWYMDAEIRDGKVYVWDVNGI